MRFLVDMGVSQRVVRWLQETGHDAVHLRDQGLQRLKDQDILDKARNEGRILLTMDLDFGYLLAASRLRTPSTVIFRLEDETPKSVIERLEEVLKTCTGPLEEGAVASVRHSVVRVRKLPI
ncbi:MAG TPA: DUF5615 family PIN-like protein [Candidatus Hydrogenedentes bacterium]|nr:DUF5615 family PIN-like protein [Candidatus Hydrogenedentota bacterium]